MRTTIRLLFIAATLLLWGCSKETSDNNSYWTIEIRFVRTNFEPRWHIDSVEKWTCVVSVGPQALAQEAVDACSARLSELAAQEKEARQ